MVATLLALVLPLGLDTFAVAAALGAMGVASRLRIALLFTVFEGGMPLIGLAAGAPLGRVIGPTADYVAIAVLLAFGVHTLVVSDDDDERFGQLVRSRGAGAVILGISISLDELAIGFTVGLLHVPAAVVSVLIAAQAFILTQIGLRLGGALSEGLREGAERLAGVALVVLGLVLLVEKLLG